MGEKVAFPAHKSFRFFVEEIMFEARIREKETSPPRRRRVLSRPEGVIHGPRKHKLKRNLHFYGGGRVSPPLSVKIRSRFWSCQIFGMSEEGISTISTVYLVAGKFLRGLPNFRLPVPFL